MKIELRHRKLASGNESLYLDFYEKGKRYYESLNLFLIPERTENDRRVNENTLKHALKIKAERILGVEKQVDDEEEKLPSKIFADYMDEHIIDIKDDKKLSDSYVKNVTKTVNIVKSYLRYSNRPRMLLALVDKRFYQNFIRYVNDVYRNNKSDEPQELSPKTKLLIQTTLNSILNQAVKDGVLRKNPYYELDKNEKFKKTPSDRTYLEVNELNAMEGVNTGSPITKQTFMFCCFTGLRHSDMLALRWKDIQKTDDGLVIHVPSMQKTKKPVIVPLGEQALKWMPKQGDAANTDKVFSNAPTLGCANRALKHMAKNAGITKLVTFHTSRHTFATLTITAGADIFTTSKLLGHTNVHTTEIYADVVMNTKVDAVNLVSGFFG